MRRTSKHETVPPNTDRIGFLLYRLGVKITESYERRIHPLGFSAVEVGTLTHLASGGQAHVRAIARALGVSPQTMVNVSLALQRRQLVSRDRSEHDERAITITITERGRLAVAEVEQVVRKFDLELAEHVGLQNVAAFAFELRRLLSVEDL